jgi:hypothetical protein
MPSAPPLCSFVAKSWQRLTSSLVERQARRPLPSLGCPSRRKSSPREDRALTFVVLRLNDHFRPVIRVPRGSATMTARGGPKISVRDEVHELVDALPESESAAARRFLEALRTSPDDSLARFLAAAPEDDEPSTPEQDRAAAARDALRQGDRISAAAANRVLLV